MDLTCEVLKLCFEKFEVGDVIRHYTGHVMYLLRHEKSCVRRLAVDEVSNYTQHHVRYLTYDQDNSAFVFKILSC